MRTFKCNNERNILKNKTETLTHKNTSNKKKE